MAYDTDAAKKEYITTSISLRAVAAKHNIPYATVEKISVREGWVAQKNKIKSKMVAKTIEKESDRLSTLYAGGRANVIEAASVLAEKIRAAADTVDITDARAVRALTNSVRDMSSIYGVQSNKDDAEQDARIANLRKQAEKDDATAAKIEVTIHDY